MQTGKVIAICALSIISGRQLSNGQAGAHAPAAGSAERDGILAALHAEYTTGSGSAVKFEVKYFKVHNGWAWLDVTPLDSNGNAIAEGGPNLLHLEDGVWKVLDLTKIPEDPKDPLGPENASPGFIRNLKKTFPGVPGDIFPRPGH